jgi:hypothetical protein
MTRFEQRRRRIRVHRRDQVGYMAGPELETRLEALEAEFTNAVINSDPVAADFLEWYADESTKYGPPVPARPRILRPGPQRDQSDAAAARA